MVYPQVQDAAHEARPLGERIADSALLALHSRLFCSGRLMSGLSEHGSNRFHDGFTVEEPDVSEAKW